MNALKLTIIALLLAHVVEGQSFFDRVSEKYASTENVGKIDVSGNFIEFSTKEGAKRNKLERIRVLYFASEHRLPKNDVLDLKKSLRSTSFEQLLTINNKGQRIEAFGIDGGDFLNEVFLIIRGQEQDLLINLSGKLYYEDLDELDFDSKDFDFLKAFNPDRS